VAAYIGSLLVSVCVLHCSAVDCSTVVYCRTVQHTHSKMGKSSQFRYNSFRFENSNTAVFHTISFITVSIYAATPPPY